MKTTLLTLLFFNNRTDLVPSETGSPSTLLFGLLGLLLIGVLHAVYTLLKTQSEAKPEQHSTISEASFN